MAGETESYHNNVWSDELYISNNCCGPNFYQKKHIAYNNPFIWLIVPYDSMAELMVNFESIDWYNIDFKKSNIRKNTFIIVVDGKVELHFMHHFFDPNCKTPHFFSDQYGSHLGYCRVWEYIYDKYKTRVELMMKTSMHPNFIVHEQDWGRNKYGITDLIKMQCKYKRIFITSRQVDFNYDKDMTKIIYSKEILAAPAIAHNFRTIDEFFNN